MATKQIAPPEVQAALTEANQTIEIKSIDRLELAAADIVINNDASYESANNIRRMAKGLQKQWEDFWAPKVAAAWNVHKMLKSAMNPVSNRLEGVSNTIAKKMGAYDTEKQRIKEALERESLRKAEEEQLLKQQAAEAAMLRGEIGKAKQLMTESQEVTAFILPDAVPKLQDTAVKDTWKIEVLDLIALAKDVVDGKAPLSCISANEVFLRAEARKCQGMPYSGVRAWTEKSYSDRGL
jgi:hypothetical protein